MEVKEGYKQTEVGIIPEDWEVARLGNLINNIEYGSSTKSKFVGKIPVLRMGNIQDGKIDWDNLVFTDNETEIQKYLLNKGNVLFNRTNTIDLVGKTAIYNGERPAIFAGYLIRIKVSDSLLNAEYLNYFLNTKPAKKHGRLVLSIAVGQANINGQKLKNYPIPLPPKLAEQEAIATVLSDTDALISSLETLLSKKRQIKLGTMQELLTGKRRLPGFTGEWETKNLAEVCNKITTGKLDANAMSETGEYRFYTCAKEYYYIDYYAFNTEALLISGNGANVGYIHYFKGKFNAYQRTYVLTDFTANPIYLKIYLESNFKNRINTEVNAGNTPYIKMNTISEMEISLPPTLAEQTAIASVLSDMDSEIEVLEKKISKYKQIKQGMMQKLLTGEIRLI
ncbi:restriction endonuclease subunit S [Leptospira sp. WS58.C1]|uniref:restriction endonuclease subunit S n=1 Tax=Leptospira TaxID=171 RepID=UPI000347D453|nr:MULTISPECIES: restriction endonuclease subunit S [unclassified Leptospira]MCR1792951.1 restriction endonuclease subunit S [Leptospira sp. id769339]